MEADEGVPIDLMFESEIPIYFRELRNTLSIFRSSPIRAHRKKFRQSDQTPQCSSEANPMPKPSPDTVFEEVDPKLERIFIEISEGIDALDGIDSIENFMEPDNLSWSKGRILAFAFHNIYNGIEQILEDIAKLGDDFDPSRASSDSGLISLMATKTRHGPAILSPELHAILDDLRKFRQVVRHCYGRPMHSRKLLEKFELFQDIFWPQFLESLERYRTHIQTARNPDFE